jgi:hypothetical protein
MVRIAAACPSPRWHRVFMAMLPAITAHARIAFRHLKPEAKAEAVQEVVANALQAFVRLVQLGKADVAYASPLARYGVAQTRDHRKVGGHLNVKDVMSAHCQANKGVKVERLDKFDTAEDAWQEIVIEDRHAGPAETARVRLDFSDWLASLKRRDRRIAEALSVGNCTSDVAKRFKISAGRVSQLRKELAVSWKRFVGDNEGNEGNAAA